MCYFCLENRKFKPILENKNHLFENIVYKTFAQFILHTFWCILTHIFSFWTLRTKCRKSNLFIKNDQIFFYVLRMHQYATECFQNEFCKCFVHEITKKVIFITFKLAKMHHYAFKCIKMYAEWIILMFCAWIINLKNFNFLIENGQ